MAGYRQFHTQFWKDEWLIDLEPMERYLFVYLFTNELSSISGIYKLPLRVIINETGLKKEFIEPTIAKFEACQKALYRDGVMWVVNMAKFHSNASPMTQKKVDGDVEKIPDCIVKQAYLYHKDNGEYPIDMVSMGCQYQTVKDKDKTKDKTKDKSKQAQAPVVLPSSLNYPEFITAWEKWVAYRKEIRKPLPPTTQESQLKMLAHHNLSTATAMIYQSIEKGWQNLFELKNGNGQHAEPPIIQESPDELRKLREQRAKDVAEWRAMTEEQQEAYRQAQLKIYEETHP